MKLKTFSFVLLSAVMCAALVAQSGAPSQTTRRHPPQRQTSASGLEQNKTLVREFYVPFNIGAVERFDAVLAPNWIEHPAAVPDQQPGREAYKPIIRGLREAMPDIRIEIKEMIAEGDRVVVRSELSATPKTEFMGVAPSGKRFTIMTIDIHRIADGRIVETWHVEDFVDALRQLGAFPPQSARTEAPSK